MAKVLVVGINYLPELTGIGKFTGEMAEWLASRGAEVRVVTAAPYYPAWRISEGYSGVRYSSESVRGVTLLRCPLWVPRKPNGVKRILHLVSFTVTSFLPTIWWSVVWRPDWIFVLEPPVTCLPAVLLAAKLSGAKSWLHVQDFEVDAAFDLGLLRSPRLRHAALGLERWLMRRCVRVSTISERMLERLGRKGIPASACVLFPNWVDTEMIAPIAGPNRLRAQLGIPESKMVLLYSGNMGEKQGLDLVIDAAGELAEDPQYLFVMCGDGSARARLEARSGHLANVVYLPLQPMERFNELLDLADIHLLPQRADAEDLVMPSKLTAMLASGKPVVATARPGTQVATVVDLCGEVVAPNDVRAFSAAIQKLGAAPELRQELGRRGREYALEHWAKDAVLTRLTLALEVGDL